MTIGTPATFDLVADIGAGAVPFVVAPASLYPSELLAAIELAIETATGSAFTVTKSFGEGGTGKWTLAKNAGTFKLLFDNDEQAQLLGVAAAATWNGGLAASFTSSAGVKGVFLPNCDLAGPGMNFKIPGHLRTDAVHTMSPSRRVKRLVANSAYSFKKPGWKCLDEDHALDGVNSAVVSWQQFIRETQLGGYSPYFDLTSTGDAPTVKIYYDADNNLVLGAATGNDGVYDLVFDPELEPDQITEGWTGLWSAELFEIVKV